MLRVITLLGVGLFLSSCSTTEFREQKGICTATWMKKIPPRYVKETYNKRMSREVPTGKIKCESDTIFGTTYTDCEQVTRREYYTVPAVRTVDRNASRRDAQISSCTQQKCNQKYGNAECKS